jgi:hypothetical protein
VGQAVNDNNEHRIAVAKAVVCGALSAATIIALFIAAIH